MTPMDGIRGQKKVPTLQTKSITQYLKKNKKAFKNYA